MRKIVLLPILCLILYSCGFYSYDYYTPIYLSYGELRSSFRAEAVKELKNPGKIYLKDNFLYINEKKEGIHIFDNHDPANPQGKYFLNIPGCIDLAIKDNILYADNYIDLIAIDLSADPPALVKRIENSFKHNPYGTFPEGFDMYYNNAEYEEIKPEKGIVIGWRKESREVFRTGFISKQPVMEGTTSSSSSGIGGSMARFTILQDYLYTLNESYLKVFRIATPSNPTVWVEEINVGWDIETIFPYQTNLFIGSRSGMYIYDANLNSGVPQKLGTLLHVTSYDPVVVEGNFAYVTLKRGDFGGVNQLDIIDISDLTDPKLICSYPMSSPTGLGIDQEILFICDGVSGVKIFDVTDPRNLSVKGQLELNSPYDLIPYQKDLVVSTPIGIFQYNYSDLANIKQLSRIAVAGK